MNSPLSWGSNNTSGHRDSLLEMTYVIPTHAVEDALTRHGEPEIFNTDQGGQFTSAAFTGVLSKNGIAISMDGNLTGVTSLLDALIS
jgi:putative transposase